ncbi:MAG TPA: ATP-binding protein [Rhizomicrobium sp.]|nr:ATP-binding protein [Rhizomicrobium sp.]
MNHLRKCGGAAVRGGAVRIFKGVFGELGAAFLVIGINTAHARLRYGVRGLSATYLAVGALGLFAIIWAQFELIRATGGVASIWGSNALMLAALLRLPRQQWLPVLVLGFATYIAAVLSTGTGAVESVWLTAANFVEILIVAIPMRRYRLGHDFSRPQTLLWFYGLALAATVSSGAMAAGFFVQTHDTAFMASLGNWVLADAMGLCVLLPLLMTVRWKAVREMFVKDQIALTGVLFGVLAGVLVMHYLLRDWPMGFMFFPVVVLLTFLRGFAGGAIGLGIIAAYMMTGVIIGNHSAALDGHAIRDQITIVQIFVAFISLTIVLIGTALEERRRLERGLAAAIAHAENSREEALVAKDAAENASRTKSMFLANMSHELRTPLNAVLGFSELMRDEMLGALGNAKYREYSGLIHGAGAHLLDLINDILDMSKVEAGKMDITRERIDAHAVISECTKLMQERAASNSLSLHIDVAQDGLVFHADRRALKQILLNLIGNAIKFTLEGGSVHVSAEARDGRICLSVRDTGIGIPAEQVHRLGNPFVQLRNNTGKMQQGTGLGLALVRTLTEMHGGRMRIESVEGVGTTVRVDLPAAPALESAAA